MKKIRFDHIGKENLTFWGWVESVCHTELSNCIYARVRKKHVLTWHYTYHPDTQRGYIHAPSGMIVGEFTEER